MNTFELGCKQFERKLHLNQLCNTFQLTIEEVFETLETADVDITTAHDSNVIGTIVNRNFGNNFNHQNGINHHQYVHKHTYHQHQYISYHISRNFSPIYLKGNFIECGLNNKEVRELCIQNYGKLEIFPVRVPLFNKKKLFI